MNLNQAIQKIITDYGVDILIDRRFVSILSELNAFCQLPYAANMLRQIYANGYGTKIHKLYLSKDKAETSVFLLELRNKFGFDIVMLGKVLYAFSLPVQKIPKPKPLPNPKIYSSINQTDLESVIYDSQTAYKDECGGIYSYPNCEIFYKFDNPKASIYTVRPGTKDIYKCAFYYNKPSDSYGLESSLEVKKISLPDTINFIPDSCFKSCQRLWQIDIPNSLIEIGDSAFEGCRSLQQIKIPNSVIRIGVSAFANCSSLQSISLPKSISNISSRLFSNCCSLQHITIPDSVINIDSDAFEACTSLKQVIIPNSVTLISDSAFAKCSNLQQITIPNSVTSIGERAFSRLFFFTTFFYS